MCIRELYEKASRHSPRAGNLRRGAVDGANATGVRRSRGTTLVSTGTRLVIVAPDALPARTLDAATRAGARRRATTRGVPAPLSASWDQPR